MLLSLPFVTLPFRGIICHVVVSEQHQTWPSFKCSVAVTAIFLAAKSNQTRKKYTSKGNWYHRCHINRGFGTKISLESSQSCGLPSRAMFGFSFVTSLFRVTGKWRVPKHFRGKDGSGTHAGSHYSSTGTISRRSTCTNFSRIHLSRSQWISAPFLSNHRGGWVEGGRNGGGGACWVNFLITVGRVEPPVSDHPKWQSGRLFYTTFILFIYSVHN